VIVVDTQVLWYSVHEGAFTALAKQVAAKDAEWVAPPLWRSEFRNTVAGYMRRDGFTLDEALEALQRAQALVAVEENPESEWILGLVARSRCTAYDLEFVALAQAAGIKLVTNDRQILDSFPGIAVSLESFAGGSA
jgi:predicted nucleic acid-binding protein